MSRLSALRVVGAGLAVMLVSTGCWEQSSVNWWPQMKWQLTVQAFEQTDQPSAPAGFVPPEGTIPFGRKPQTSQMPLAETELLQNPRPTSLATLESGKLNFGTFCSPCHGLTGLADGPVSGPPFGKGPFVGVLPIAGPIGSQITKAFSDGHIYTVISQGIRRMPSYKRIPSDSRWDIVNYVRYLNGQGPVPAQTAQAATPPQGATQ